MASRPGRTSHRAGDEVSDVEEAGLPVTPVTPVHRVLPPLRIRSDSNGSTRGAFTIAADHQPKVPPQVTQTIKKRSANPLKSADKATEGDVNLLRPPTHRVPGSRTTAVRSLAPTSPPKIVSGDAPDGVWTGGPIDQLLPTSYQQYGSPSTADASQVQSSKELLSTVNQQQTQSRAHYGSNGTLAGTNFLPQAKPEAHFHPFQPRSVNRTIFSPLSALYSNVTNSFNSSLNDFYYLPSEDVGPVLGCVRALFYDPTNPEFTSLQQSSWAVILGVFFGVATALWGRLIESCVEFVWKDIPESLLEWGFFTDVDGSFPLPHYCWICTAVCGGFLSWITVVLPIPIPGQNEWIEGVHRQGIVDHSTFWYILAISTGGMMSGLSLGPELPLVLLSGMVGSYLAKLTHQSVLSARVMVLTAGGAAVGGFFGFPMAGALFVLELPHRMGLQYFEALSPSNVSSIIAVLFNRIVTGNDLTGYYNYPFLASSLKSNIFHIAIVYGLIGALVGTIYCQWVGSLKAWVHDWFRHSPANHAAEKPVTSAAYNESTLAEETLPLVGSHVTAPVAHGPSNNLIAQGLGRITGFSIKHEPLRAAVTGVVAGLVVGVVGMFLPHNFFWGEAQLQTLIDQGRSPLPVFGRDGEPTEALLAWSYCLVNPNDAEATRNGPGLACNFILIISKYFCIGLSVGTGICGGQFWGPLYVGAAASNLFVDLMKIIYKYSGLGGMFFEHPCVAVLCIMGSAHVVVFRAHTAIMLLLTLTISAFREAGTSLFTAGDYAAVFPLLVVSCFVSLMATRGVVFYKQQRCRGDIIASPEVLCEPGKVGQPIIHIPMAAYDYDDYDTSCSGDGSGLLEGSSIDELSEDGELLHPRWKTVQSAITSDAIEREFSSMQQGSARLNAFAPINHGDATQFPTVPNADSPSRNAVSDKLSLDSKIEELLSNSIESDRMKAARSKKGSHRRIVSGSDALLSYSSIDAGIEESGRVRASSYDQGDAGVSGRDKKGSSSSPSGKVTRHQRNNSRDSARSTTPTRGVLRRVDSKGKIEDFQPSLIEQARLRASSVRQPNVPKPTSHSRRISSDGSNMVHPRISGDIAGAISQDDIERAFSSVQTQSNLKSPR